MAEGVGFEFTIPSLMVDTRKVTESASLRVPMGTDGVSCYSRSQERGNLLFAGKGGVGPRYRQSTKTILAASSGFR
jgi:hypothetical protein